MFLKHYNIPTMLLLLICTGVAVSLIGCSSENISNSDINNLTRNQTETENINKNTIQPKETLTATITGEPTESLANLQQPNKNQETIIPNNNQQELDISNQPIKLAPIAVDPVVIRDVSEKFTVALITYNNNTLPAERELAIRSITTAKLANELIEGGNVFPGQQEIIDSVAQGASTSNVVVSDVKITKNSGQYALAYVEFTLTRVNSEGEDAFMAVQDRGSMTLKINKNHKVEVVFF